MDTVPFVKPSDTADAQGTEWVANSIVLVGGDDAFDSMGLDDDIAGYDLFRNPEETDAPIIVGNWRSIKDASGSPNYGIGKTI